jgi:hypothetical protein
VALRNHLSLLAVGLHRPLAVHDAAAVASTEVPGLQDHQLEPVVLPSEDAQLGVRVPVVADAGNLLDIQSVPDEPHHGGVDLQLPCAEHLRVSVQTSLPELAVTRLSSSLHASSPSSSSRQSVLTSSRHEILRRRCLRKKYYVVRKIDVGSHAFNPKCDYFD